MDFKDKVVVITGASRGLGKALAKAFAEKHASVVMSSVGSSQEQLEMAAREVGAMAVTADVTIEQTLQQLADAAVGRFGRIDVWINNAGIWFPHALVEEMNMTRVRHMIDVNLFGTIQGTRVAIAQLKRQRSGMLINVISVTGLDGTAGSSGYAASKSGIIGFDKSVRKEVAPDIKVISVYPGGMKTTLFGEVKAENYDSFMDPLDVARVIVSNASQEVPQEEQIIRNIIA